MAEENEQWIDNNPDKKMNFSGVTKNPWMILSGILAIVVIVLLIFNFTGGFTGRVIGGLTAGEILVDHLNGLTGDGVEFVKSASYGKNLYEITVAYQGENIPVYITKDGKYFVHGASPITGEAVDDTNTPSQTPKDVPKTDKPVVEAFVFSYCPYGLQFEKAMVPVYNLLKDKVDINIVAIGAMHGEYEKTETLRQLCIQKNYGKDKLWVYLDKFAASTAIGQCSSDTKCSVPLVEQLMTSLSIDKTKINSCMTTDAAALYDKDVARVKALGISGSPGFVINGVQVQVNRSPSAIQKAICDAFTTAPAECSQTLSTAAASPGFGASTGSSTVSTGATC